MNGAELQTLREACGLTREALGDLCDVQARTIKHWEIRGGAPVPQDVAAIVRRLSRWVMFFAADLASGYSLKQVSGEVVLFRYRETAHMAFEDRSRGMLAEVHGAMITRLTLNLMEHGIPCRVVWFDPRDFADWLKARGAADTPDSRSSWAETADD